jgi:RNA polymerase sigma-70 factor (ECF subfamily)
VNGCPDISVVEDVVQETWLRGVSGLRRFDWRSSFSTWLRGIALNVSRERLRSERIALQVDLTPDSIDRMEACCGDRDHEGRVDLERALRALPEGQRMVLVLHDLEGFTHAEVARMLGISAGTSKSQLHDARETLEGVLTKGL